MLKFKSCLRLMGRMSSSSTDVYKNLEVSKVGGIMSIAINRPEKRNAVDHDTARSLVDAFKHFEQDENTLVAILYGKGGTFCSGYDLSSLATSDGATLRQQEKYGFAPMGPSRMCFSKPVIASIDGYAVAGGLELALLCDFRVVDESAILGVYCRRFGIPLIDGGTVRLQKLIGLSRALDLIMTGRSVTGKEAVDIGLANHMTSTGSALAQATKLAHSLMRFPQKCLNADRLSAYNAAYNATSMEDAFKFEYENGIKVLEEESIPGAKRFQEGVGRHASFNLNITNPKPKHKL